MKWYAFEYESEDRPACMNYMCETSMGEPDLEVINVEIIRSPHSIDGLLVRGIVRDNLMPVNSKYFCIPVEAPRVIMFDVNAITEEDVPAIMAKLAELAGNKLRNKLKSKEVVELRKTA